ncbi:MAG: hypothetical protein M9941_13020 [Anaerolineae bacterium]|nr:hypothetical protein [Anaerolineae bacterium]
MSTRSVFSRLFNRRAFVGYASSSVFVKITVMLSAIVILRWVPPGEMGIWQTLVLVLSYSDIVGLGLMRGLNRELPFFMGRGDSTTAHGIAGTARSYAFMIAVIGAIGFLTATFVPGLSQTEWRIGLVCMGVIWWASTYRSYLQVTFRANSEFLQLSYVQFAEAILNVVTLILVFWWGYVGMVVRAALLAVLVMLMMYRIRPIRNKQPFQWHHFRLLLATGIPLYIAGYLTVLAMGFDRVLLLSYGTLETIGLYAPVAAVITAMTTLPAAIIAYTSPKMTFKLGQSGNVHSIRIESIRAGVASVMVSLPAVVIGWIVIPPAFYYLFPEYLPALPAVRIALFAGIAWAAINGIATAFYVLKTWRHLYIFRILFAVTKWVFPWLCIQFMAPLVGVSLGGAIAGSIMFFVTLILVLHATRAAILDEQQQVQVSV